MKYVVEVKKIKRTIIEVDADSKAKAMKMARNEAYHGSVLWSEPCLRTRLSSEKEGEHR